MLCLFRNDFIGQKILRNIQLDKKYRASNQNNDPKEKVTVFAHGAIRT